MLATTMLGNNDVQVYEREQAVRPTVVVLSVTMSRTASCLSVLSVVVVTAVLNPESRTWVY
jgi:hypothetical protein